MSASRTLLRKTAADQQRRHRCALERRSHLAKLRSYQLQQLVGSPLSAEDNQRVAELEQLVNRGRRGSPFRRHIDAGGGVTRHATKASAVIRPRAA